MAAREHPTGAAGQVHLRAFLALAVPSAGVMLESLFADMELQTLPIRWLAPDGLHLTLAFLGETSLAALTACWPAVVQFVATQRPLSLALRQPEPFPDVQRPRLVVAPVADARGALRALADGLAGRLHDRGYDRGDQPFQPHVSLGRIRPPLLKGQATSIANALRGRRWPGADPFTAQAVSLMRSDLFPDGARYTVLARAELATP